MTDNEDRAITEATQRAVRDLDYHRPTVNGVVQVRTRLGAWMLLAAHLTGDAPTAFVFLDPSDEAWFFRQVRMSITHKDRN